MLRSRLLSTARRSMVITPKRMMFPAFPTTQLRLSLTPSLIRSYSHAPELTRDIIKERVLDIFEGFDKVAEDKSLEETSDISKDLGLDSLDIVDIVMALEEEFSIEIPEKDVPGLKTIGDAINYIENTPDSA
ncbi:acyl carrier protein, mitochondrial precursor,putative [Wickerhamomyces ciferrii]|uniref:Acyl carrier protein n=1 Tax=Wickerhamomyces ciferrii (strain ATCC 14091 / BCRC 22168 / CBS 111 / JCM 3599 / NBRC 0793 / NRRL Y-1031 F-60-10) TaxID=1206466 RepID=K0KV00_WICCF|nr:acyl carrier protein, mitochondrial precursor,putative [Wickerhamomyces ciferrii]CCH47066.1 acyl carrier protein, mitochondrial precursor,putative [Wickerhamomyces ciferrii]